MNPLTIQLGTWLSLGSPVAAELASLCGFDWVLLDLEHGCGSEAALTDQIRAITARGTRAIVRVGAPHDDLIARVLDWGAHGIMVPHVNSAAEAEAVVCAACYLPRGHRGYSRTVRAHDYGLRSPDSTPAPLIMAQIETLQAVSVAAEIAAVDGVDVLFVGPADLQHDIKHHCGLNTVDYEDCLSRVLEAAATANKSAGLLVRDLNELPRRGAQGFHHVAVQSDLAILREGFNQILRAKP